MTTIAFRDGIMASDSFCDDNGVRSPGRKLFKTSHENEQYIIGICGDYLAGRRYIEHFWDENPPANPGDFNVLIWDGKRLWEDDKKAELIRIPKVEFYAIGSGAAAALGAMHMGASAKEAIRVAKKVDTGTHGPVKTMTFNLNQIGYDTE